MTTKPKAQIPAVLKKKPTTEVATWDEELARQAAIAASTEESTSTGQFFSLKSGVLSFNDNPLPNNEMAVIILDGILENVFYGQKYDPDNPQGPACFAFGREEKSMAPHNIVVENQNSQAESCAECPMNEWGSAETGRGKACRNTRRLAMIPAGTFHDGKFKPFTEAEQFESTVITYMKLPVTSVKSYASFVKQIAAALRRPPHAIFTRIAVRPDATSQFKVNFEPLSSVPNDLLEVIMARHKEAVSMIEFPYAAFEEREAPVLKRGAKAAMPARGKPQPSKRY